MGPTSVRAQEKAALLAVASPEITLALCPGKLDRATPGRPATDAMVCIKTLAIFASRQSKTGKRTNMPSAV